MRRLDLSLELALELELKLGLGRVWVLLRVVLVAASSVSLVSRGYLASSVSDAYAVSWVWWPCFSDHRHHFRYFHCRCSNCCC